MTRIKQRILALERSVKHIDAPDGVIIYNPNDPNEPEASIKRFNDMYLDCKYTVIFLPEKEKSPDEDIE